MNEGQPEHGGSIRTPRSRWTTLGVAFVAFLVPMLLWALASPLMSIPDEPAHAIRAAAVVRGEVTSEAWEENPTTSEATVPNYVAHTHELTCFAFRADLPAGCQQGVKGNPDRLVTTGTSAGANSPVYYAIVGLPTLVFSGNSALYAMRGMNAVLCAAALAIMVSQLMQLARWRWSLIAAFVATTPMLLYLGGAINPNGLEAASTGALTATLIALMRTPSTRWVLAERSIFIVVLAVLLLSTRSIAMLWVLLAIGTAFLLGKAERMRELVRRPAVWIVVALCVVAGMLTLYWYINPPQLAPTVFAGVGTSVRTAFIMMILQTFDFANGWIGFFGWVDTPAPGFTVAVWAAALVALAVGGAVATRGRGRIAVIVLMVLLVLVPAVSQAAVVGSIGYIWQGRYTLALLIMFLVACGVALDDADRDRLPAWTSRVVGLGAVLLAAGHVFAYFWTLRRYVVGVPGDVVAMVVTPHWQPPLGWVPLTVAYAIAVGAGAYLVWRTFRRGPAVTVSASEDSTRPAGDVAPSSSDEPGLDRSSAR